MIGVPAKRVIARVSIAVALVCLALQATFAWWIHHGLALALTGMIAPVLAVLLGLNYLHSTRR